MCKKISEGKKDKPDSMLDWWDFNESNYNVLKQMVSRALIQMRGGCDIDRSYNYFTTLTRQPTSNSMAPLTKETRVMGHWNKESVASYHFGVFDFK